MKTHILAMILIFAETANARIGETALEIQARYGEGKASRERVPGVPSFQYEKNGFVIEVSILDGRSVFEMLHRKAGVISDDDIKELLKVNATASNAWRFDKKEKRWERGGKPKLVAYREPGHDDYFVIKDLEACKEAEKKKKPATEGF